MSKIRFARALIYCCCLCIAPAGVAFGDVVWQADSGDATLVIDPNILESLGLVATSPGADPITGAHRLQHAGASSLTIDVNQGAINATSGGTLLHHASLSFKSLKSGEGLTIENLIFEIAPGDDIYSITIRDAATMQPLFLAESVRAVYAPVSGVLSLEIGELIATKQFAQSLNSDRLSNSNIGTAHARFALVWAGGDDPASDPGFPGSGGAPRGACSPSTGQDVIVGDLYASVDNPASEQIGGIWYDTFSVGTTSCNIGDTVLTWQSSSGTIHPAIGQNCFRLKDGRFEQIGQSWLKHGFAVAAGSLCCPGGCTGPSGGALYPGCSDPYGATLNNSQSAIKPKFRVNPTTGIHVHGSNPSYDPNDETARRLQVRHTDIDPSLNSGALYWVEGQYVHQEDSASGNANNNASYRPITVASSGTNEYSFGLTGSTQREMPGIRAWQDTDPTVTETDVHVPNDGLYIVSSKATDNGNGTWHYEYAVQNLNGNRGLSSFSIPIDPSATASNIGFHDVDYHDGDGEGSVNRDGTDWTGIKSGSTVSWTMTDVGTNSNALLWGTMYNFRFDANRAPAANNPNATLTLWRAGSPGSVTASVQGPNVGPQDCQPNGTEDATDIANGTSLDCNNDGVPDECQSFAPSTLTVEIVVSGLGTERPVFVTAPPGDTSRLFIVTQVGLIYIYNLNTQSLNATPFLDLSGQTTTDGERGLLGMAFHPNYASNGRFYVNHTNLSGNTLIRQFTVSGNPDIANAGSGITLKTIAQDFSNHNSGCLQFSPIDGYLYCPMGDGGGANDQFERSQDENSLLGKILRLDVDNPGNGYIPPNNPASMTLPEVWAKGLRNPWRFSFDRLTGDMYIGDVGQDTREEIDFQSATSNGGENYGWDCREGLIAAPGEPGDGFGCNAGAGGFTDPILDYATHVGGTCTVVGGYVYRGCEIPWLGGTYFYAEWCADWVKTLRYDGSTISDQQDVTADLNDGITGSLSSIVSFGEDAAGELYIVTYGGTIYRIIEAGPPPVCGNNTVENGEQCDDGNTTPGDGCDQNCQAEFSTCGNNVVEFDEECDDGNTVPGDGCDANCNSEFTPGADACGNAPQIYDGTYDFDTTGATTDGVAHASCQFNGQTYEDVWWQYNATCNGNLTVSLCPSIYDTDLVIYDTCTCIPGDANLLGCNDDACGTNGWRSELTVPVIAGNCYLIRVGGYNSGDEGPGNMTISNDGSPCNTCGNGTVETGEECDDGNTTNGDGCSSTCQNEFDDCNNNSIDDLVDISMGTSPDCNGNNIPDECEIAGGAADCNNNDVLDSCELADGSAADCNNNGTLDICDTPTPPGDEIKNYDVVPAGSPVAIPDNDATGISSTFTVPDSGTIVDVNIELEATHTYVGDICATVTHNGTTVRLIQRPGGTSASGDCYSGSPFGCGNNNYDIVLDDEGTGGAIEDHCGTNTSPPAYTPFDPLSAFDGMDKAGLWTITIADNAGQDTGSLVRWGLVITNQGGFTGTDCNNNQIDDAIDIAQGTETDCDGNCVPDSCQIAANASLDCNGNGQLDSCEVASDPSLDCDGGPIGVPAMGESILLNNCQFCHNVDGTGGQGFPGPNIRNHSRTFIKNKITVPGNHAGGTFGFSDQQFADLEAFLSDTGGRGRPDGVPDSCQLPLPDCDMDGDTDGCELDAGTQVDADHNGIPDDCESVLTGACCAANGSCSVGTAADCSTSGGSYQGDGSSCTPNPCPQPTGACCAANGGCTIDTAAGCSSAGGTYQGDGSNCSPNPCPQPTGACCDGAGSCAIDTAAGCAGSGGMYQGDGSNCSPNPCPQPMGACCATNGTCSINTTTGCTASGGSYQGDGSSCSPNPCPQPTGACCDVDGSCVEDTAAGCSTSGGSYQGDGSSCTPNPCPQPTGACCIGGCTITNEMDCTVGGGTYLGDDTVCGPTTCPPDNDDCVDALPIGNGVTAFDSIGATTDGPAHIGVCDAKFNDSQVGSDIWYCYTATCTGTLTLSTCNDATYDTKLAIYDGCTCPPEVIIACQDDAPGCGGNTTTVSVTVMAGNQYLIRVGGYNGASGTGNLTVTCEAFACVDPIDCDDQNPCTFDECIANECVNTLIDGDNDGEPDCSDACPNDPNKIDPGQCGCGNPDTDSDNDGTADCNDGCPNDPNKIAPGICGCGVSDADSDNDGTVDCDDNCPNDPNKIDPGTCGCGVPETAPDGDLNADGNVNGLDVQSLIDGLLNGPTTYYNCHGDYNASGQLDMGDVPFIVDAILGL